MVEDSDLHKLIVRALGSFAGVVASLVMVAPQGTKNALYRAIIGLIMGIIFSPATQSLLPFLRGDGWEFDLASSAASGFCVWFILEGVARTISSRDTMRNLLEELLRLHSSRDPSSKDKKQ